MWYFSVVYNIHSLLGSAEPTGEVGNSEDAQFSNSSKLSLASVIWPFVTIVKKFTKYIQYACTCK